MPETAARRFIALDVFRGMTICFMIIVNTPGNRSFTFSPLLHAQWNGFTPTDLVYPSFLFAVGNALSFARNKWKSITTSQVVIKIFMRTLLIFAIGFLLGWVANIHQDTSGRLVLPLPDQSRISGVLQRIALVYGITALIALFFSIRTMVIISIGILLAYWLVLVSFSTGIDPYDIQGNVVGRMDRWALGARHLYREGMVAFEPEGILSTLPAAVNVVAGYIVGCYVQRKGYNFETLFYTLFAGFLLIAAGYFWNFFMPVNKKLWTSSFVLLTIGLDCAVIASIIYFVDLRKKNRLTYFFQVFGKNPLFIYLLAEIVEVILGKISISNLNSHEYLYEHVFRYTGQYTGSLLFAVTIMLFCWSAGYLLDRKKIYVRV